MSNPSKAQSTPEPGKGHSPARRWLIRIGVALGVVLVGLVIAAPWVASSNMVRDYAVSTLNETLRGSFEVDRISTGWLGPTEVWGFRARDPEGREVLAVEHATVSPGLLGLARTWERLGTGEVKSGRLTFYADPGGGFSFVRAFSLRSPGEPSGKPYPAVRVKAHVSDVSVKLVAADNAGWELSRIEGDAEMDTLGRYKADLTALAEGGGKLRLTGDVRDLLRRNEFSVFGSKSTVKVTTEEPVEAGPLLALLGVKDTLGKLKLKALEAKIESRSADVRCDVSVAGLRPAKPDAAARPIDLGLSGILSGNLGDPDGLCAGTVRLTGDPGNFSARVLYRRSPLPTGFSTTALMEAFTAGDARGLPDVLVEADGFVDLGAVGQAAPALLGLQPGVTLTSGRLNVRKLRFFTRDKISGDDRSVEPPSADGAVEFKDVVASILPSPKRQDGTVPNSGTVPTLLRIEPASFDFNMRLLPEKGLEVSRAELKSAFATVAAAGTLEHFAATFRADLAGLYAQLRPVFDLGAFELDGSLNGEFLAMRPAPDELRIERLTADARSLLFRQGKRRLAFDASSLSAQGAIRLENGRPVRYDVTSAAIDVDCTTVGGVSGWADVKAGGFHADVKLDRADLANVLGKLKGLEIDAGPLARWGGRIETPQTLFDRADENSPIVSSGRMTVKSLTLDGGALPVTDATAEWKNATLGAGLDNLTAPWVLVKGGILAASAGNVRLTWGKEFSGSGTGQVIAHLGAVLPIVSRAANTKAIPDVSGALDWTGEVRWDPREIAVKSKGRIDDLVLRAGSRVERAASAAFDESARASLKDGRIVKLETDCATFNVPGRLVGSVSGWIKREGGTFDARADLAPADLAFVDAWLKAFGVQALGRYAGVVDVKAAARRDAAGGTIFADGSAVVRGGAVEGRPLGLDVVNLTWKEAELASGYTALKVKSIDVASTPVSAAGTGVAAKWEKDFELAGNLRVEADAARALGAVQALTGLKDLPALTGWVKWSGDASTAPLKTGEGTEVTFAGSGEARDVRLSVGGRPRDVGTGSFTEAAQFTFRDGKPAGLNVSKADLRFPGKLVGAGTLSYDFAGGGFKSDVDVAQADVATAADWADAFGISQLKRYGGSTQVRAAAWRASAKDPILSEGTAIVHGVRVDSRPLPNIPDVTVEWRGASLNLAAAGKDFQAKSVTLTAGPVKATAEGLAGKLSDALQAKGTVNLTADLAAVQPAFVQLSGITGLQPFAGRLTYAGLLDTNGRITSLDGKTTIENLRIGTGATAFTDPKVEIDARAEIDPVAENLGLNRIILRSTPVAVTASGLIRKYKTDRSVDLRGDYAGAWERLMPLAYQFYPSLRGKVLLAGPTGGPFTLKGSLNAVSAKPPYLRPGLEGKARVGWTYAEVAVLDYPWRFGPATLEATMKDGKVTLPATEVPAVPAENGKLRLAGTLDLAQDPPVLTIPGRLVIAENFKVDREFAGKMLNRFNPIFGGDAEGRATLTVQDLTAPLSEAAARRSLAGSGRLDLASLKVNAQGLLGDILKLLELAPDARYDIPPTGADFVLRSGRVEYRDFAVQVNERTDLRFSGSVGLFDDRLDMVVSLPGASAVLGRLGVKGSLIERLAGSRIEIPITGSRRAPTLDVPGMLRRLTIGTIERLLGGDEEKPK